MTLRKPASYPCSVSGGFLAMEHKGRILAITRLSDPLTLERSCMFRGVFGNGRAPLIPIVSGSGQVKAGVIPFPGDGTALFPVRAQPPCSCFETIAFDTKALC